jgi:hypothetical protein
MAIVTFRLGLAVFFPLGFLPSRISDCGLGGLAKAARKAVSARRRVSWSV